MKLFSLSVPAMLLLSFSTGNSRVFNETAEVCPVIYTHNTAHSLLSTKAASEEAVSEETLNLYSRISPKAKGLNQDAFVMAMKGYQRLLKAGKIHNKQVITIIDYSVSSLRKRLFVVDLEKGQVIYNTYVAHGMNSGKEYARKFSNSLQSLQSSLGFYVTRNTYTGKNGVALKLDGMEKGINDNAFRRGIVLHGAPYVNEPYCRHQGYMGRSEGCPAVPQKETMPIIQSIRNGSAVFVYYPSQQYLGKSKLLADNTLSLSSGSKRPA